MIALPILMILVMVAAAQILLATLRRQPAARRPFAVVAALAVIGCLLTGHPLMPERAAQRVPVDTLAVDAFAGARRGALTIAGDTAAWLTLAEALEGGGNTTDAVGALSDALARSPGSADLWIGLGSALVLHADGALTPAARLAFARGEALAPGRPELKRLRLLACARAHVPCAA